MLRICDNLQVAVICDRRQRKIAEKCKFVLADVLMTAVVSIARAVFFILKWKTKHYGLKTMFRFSYFFCTMEMLYINWPVVNCLSDHLFFTDVVEIDLLECEHSFNDVIHSNFWTSQLIPDIESRLKVFSLSFFRSNLAGTSSQQGKTYWPCTLC